MPNRNMHEVMGHLGRDPELRYTPSNQPVCRLSIATSNDYKKGNEWVKNQPSWHNVVIWGELASLVTERFQKGDAIMVRGKSRTRDYEKGGIKGRITEIIATEVYVPVYPKKQYEGEKEAAVEDYDDAPDADIPF
ncbi:MAG: single-stranded DNA-binding protein [Thermoanaerobacteraceae bacterium]|nr:single-stranded DNA-binding protein [Thermoanaerobacteraceae bacterium]